MATGALDANGVWIYGEDDSEATFSALLNKHASSIGATMKGRIAQIVSASTQTEVATTSETYVDCGLTASITPKFSTSKIVIICSQGIGKNAPADSFQSRIVRDGAEIARLTTYGGTSDGAYTYRIYSASLSVSAGSTASTTVKTQMFRQGTGGTIRAQQDSSTSSIVLLEITQ